jgi:hypothetical protein
MKNKITNILVFLVAVSIYLLIHIFWQNVCSKGGCTYELMDTYLYPLYYGSLALTGFFAAFLFLPAHYFTAWFKWIFSWAFPISVLIVMSNVSTGGGLFPIFAREVIILLSYFWGGVSLLFVAWHWWSYRTHKK